MKENYRRRSKGRKEEEKESAMYKKGNEKELIDSFKTLLNYGVKIFDLSC